MKIYRQNNSSLKPKQRKDDFMKKIRRYIILIVILVNLLSLIINPVSTSAQRLSRATNFDSVDGYKVRFILDFNEYPSFKNTWLHEVSENNKLEIELIMNGKSDISAMRIFGKDGDFAPATHPMDSPWTYYPNGVNYEPHIIKGAYQFESPYSWRNNWYTYNDLGSHKLTSFPYHRYRKEENTNEEQRKQYATQAIVVTMEENSGDKRIKLWGIDNGDNREYVYTQLSKTDEIYFDWKRRPVTEIIRVDKLDSFTEIDTPYSHEYVFNCNEDYSYYRGCEGFDGETEWVAPPLEDIYCYRKITDENGNLAFQIIEHKDYDEKIAWKYEDAIEYIKENYETVPVTDPMAEPDLTPTPEELRRQQIDEVTSRYNLEEYEIEDKDLKSKNAEHDALKYGKYRDEYGIIHKVSAIDGKIGFDTYKSELTGVARFQIHNNTAAWIDEIASNGVVDVEIRHYKVDWYIDELYLDSSNRYFMRLKGNNGEQWYMETSTSTKRKGDLSTEWIYGSNYVTQTDEGYYLFEPLTSFSEDFIDMYPGSKKNLEVIMKFESEDKLEIDNIEIKRQGTVVDTIEPDELEADLGFRLHFFNDSYFEDGSYYERNFPDDFERLMNAHSEYVKKYENVKIDIDADTESEKKETDDKKDEADDKKDDEQKPTENKSITVWSENENIKISVDDKEVTFPDAMPFVDENSRTLSPIRAISEAAGFTVAWDGEEQKVTISKDGNIIILYIGSPLVSVNGKAVTMDTKAQIINGRTYIPVRFIGESLGYEVIWK